MRTFSADHMGAASPHRIWGGNGPAEIARRSQIASRPVPSPLGALVASVLTGAVLEAVDGDPLMRAWMFDLPDEGQRYAVPFDDVCSFIGVSGDVLRDQLDGVARLRARGPLP